MPGIGGILALVGCIAISCGGGSSTGAARSLHLRAEGHIAAAQALTGMPMRPFAATSPWNAPVPATAAIDPDSGPIVRALDALVAEEQRQGRGPSVSTTEYSVPIVRVPASQPKVRVRLVSRYQAPALREAFSAVPIPSSVVAAAGHDKHLVVWQPASDKLWEFWHIVESKGQWETGWGGAFDEVSKASGVYGPAAWPGATGFWGASASGLSIAGGVITIEDLEYGSIDHALTMSVPNVRGGVYSSPATRTDGRSAEPLALPEGAHLRLNPNLDLSKLRMPHFTRMLADAAQRYGIFIRDGARNVAFNAQDPTPTGTEPYRGSGGFYEGSYPQALLESFPWDELQLLKMELHPWR